MDKLKEKKGPVRLVATDCDGVLTDGGLYYSANGDTMRRFCVLDGVGFQRLKKAGILTAIITAEKNAVIKARADKLGIDFLLMGIADKLEGLSKLCADTGIDIRHTVYIGDDLPDIPAIRAAGLGAAPSNAFPDVKAAAGYVTERAGGYGAFREVCDYLLGEKA